jgi:hypothetical protein
VSPARRRWYPSITVKAFVPGPRALTAMVAVVAVMTVFALLAVSAARPARAAEEVLVSLDFGSDPALPDCPGAADFRRDVVRQLGRDPFRDQAPRRLVVRLYASGARTAGRVEWRDAHDEWEGERTFSSRNESCAQLTRAMALATAIQIQLLARLEAALPAPPARAESAPVPAPAAPPAVAETPPAPAPHVPLLAVDVGAGVIEDAGPSPAFVLPRVAVSIGRPSGLGARLAVSGLGPSAGVTRTDGTAEIDRFVVTLEAIRGFRAARVVEPLLAAGLGLQDVRARGTPAMAQLAGHAGQAFSGLLSASAGLAFAIVPRLALVAEAQLLLFSPSVKVQVGSAEAAHLDGAALYLHGGLLARF